MLEKQSEFQEIILKLQAASKQLNLDKFLPMQIEDESFKNATDFIFKNENVKKKELLANFRKRVKSFVALSLKDLSLKYEKFWTGLNSVESKKTALANSKEGLLISENVPTISQNLANLGNKLSENYDLSTDLSNLIDILEKTSRKIEKMGQKEMDYKLFQKVFNKINQFENEFQNKLEITRDDLLILNAPNFPKIDFGFDFSLFQKSLEIIKARNSSFEKFAYSRLSELRDQNTQLMIVQNHINK